MTMSKGIVGNGGLQQCDWSSRHFSMMEGNSTNSLSSCFLFPSCWNKVNLKFTLTKQCQTTITHDTNQHCRYAFLGQLCANSCSLSKASNFNLYCKQVVLSQHWSNQIVPGRLQAPAMQDDFLLQMLQVEYFPFTDRFHVALHLSVQL